MAISGDPDIAGKLRDGLKRAVENVTTALDVDFLPQIGTADVVALHVPGSVDADIGNAIDQLPGTAYVMMVVDEPKIPDFVNALRADDRVTVLLAARQASEPAVGAIARHMTSGQIFGLEQRLPAGAEVHEIRVESYPEKLACIEAVQRFAKHQKLRGKYRDAITQCLDELLMNALYVAPREALAKNPSDQVVDKETIAARVKQAVVVRYAFAEKRFFLSVSDTYGALDRDALLRAWQRAVATQASGESETSDEALGVYLITNSATSVSYHHAPGVATECVCTFDVGAAKLQLQELGFYRETDPAQIEALAKAAEAPPPPAPSAEGTAAAGPSPAVKITLMVLIALVVIAIIAVLLTRG